MERTGYSLDVTTGQRKYGGPPPGWEGPPPGTGCEVGYVHILVSVSVYKFEINKNTGINRFHKSVSSL